MEESRDLLINDIAIKENPISRGCSMKPKTLDALSCDKLAQLPESMGSLVSLTQLDLCGTGIEELPESIGSMEALETLDASWCKFPECPEVRSPNSPEVTSPGVYLTELEDQLPLLSARCWPEQTLASASASGLGSNWRLDLPYDYDALQPATSGEIMQLHRQKKHRHYQASNEALEQLHDAIKFNGGGHVNHSIVWNNLAPIQAGGGEPPKGSLGWAIDNHFGSAL
ncbi:hypothetical protein NL676_035206 [Syzygium grande]|nr:hypothetical protein NL676_035206 [Syzygium grande]